MKVDLKCDNNSIRQEEIFGYDTYVYDIDCGEKGEISMILSLLNYICPNNVIFLHVQFPSPWINI